MADDQPSEVSPADVAALPPEPLREPSGDDDGAPMPEEAVRAQEDFERAAASAHAELDDDRRGRATFAETLGRRRHPPEPPSVFPRLDDPSAERQVLGIINAPIDVRTFCRVLDAFGYGFPRAVVAGNEQGQTVIYAEPIEE